MSVVPSVFPCLKLKMFKVEKKVKKDALLTKLVLNAEDKHRDSTTLTLLNVLGVLGVLNVLNVLHVLNVLNVLDMPMDASLACWALFFNSHV